jgi:hypothetical protein
MQPYPTQAELLARASCIEGSEPGRHADMGIRAMIGAKATAGIMLVLLLIPTDALAQSRTFYGAIRQGHWPLDHRQRRRDHNLRRGWPGDRPHVHKRQPDDDLRQRWAPRRHCHDNQTTGQMT